MGFFNYFIINQQELYSIFGVLLNWPGDFRILIYEGAKAEKRLQEWGVFSDDGKIFSVARKIWQKC